MGHFNDYVRLRLPLGSVLQRERLRLLPASPNVESTVPFVLELLPGWLEVRFELGLLFLWN